MPVILSSIVMAQPLFVPAMTLLNWARSVVLRWAIATWRKPAMAWSQPVPVMILWRWIRNAGWPRRVDVMWRKFVPATARIVRRMILRGWKRHAVQPMACAMWRSFAKVMGRVAQLMAMWSMKRNAVQPTDSAMWPKSVQATARIAR